MHSVSFPGFLGDTSYSNTLTDAASEFLLEGHSTNQEENVPMDSKRVYLGAQVLSLLDDLPFYRDVVSARFKLWEGWCLGWPLTIMIFDIMEEMWCLLQSDPIDKNIHALKLSKEMFQTHARPFKTPANMPWSDFKHALSGRWETVGLMFCITGLSTEWLSEDDPIFQQPGSTDPRSLATMASAVSDICLQFCDGAGIINDIVCWLLMHQTTLLTTVYGDSGKIMFLCLCNRS
jgi:chromatin structure-remodeling complex subunit RSC3/30